VGRVGQEWLDAMREPGGCKIIVLLLSNEKIVSI
jgi:hypothetical protein